MNDIMSSPILDPWVLHPLVSNALTIFTVAFICTSQPTFPSCPGLGPAQMEIWYIDYNVPYFNLKLCHGNVWVDGCFSVKRRPELTFYLDRTSCSTRDSTEIIGHFLRLNRANNCKFYKKSISPNEECR